MTKAIPLIEKFMTTTPHSIGAEQSIGKAHQMMKEFNIRHLPVLGDTQLTGIISDRDIKLALSINGVDPEKTKVGEIANTELFLVRPESKLDDVVRTMSEKKIGSVLVVDHHRLVGIFTTTDALKAFADLMEKRLSH